MMCTICGSRNVDIFTEKPDIFICSNCKNAFRKTPTNKIIYSTKIPMPDYFSKILSNKHHYNYIDKNIGFKNINSLLDIGSGDGSLIKYISRKHKKIEITAIEPGSEFCKNLRKLKSVHVINDYMEKVQINKTFDLVIMSHVLEHLENPVHSIKYIYNEFLCNGSILYVDIPNMDYELRTTAAAKMAPNMHLYFFSGFGIKCLLNMAGFKNENILGNKYSTLPKSFILRAEKLGMMHNQINITKIIYKILNKLSIYNSSFKQVVFCKKIKEIKLEDTNPYFNNIALIAKKVI